ncbi:hypothetical protein FN846DRAFT_209003 [Sphaerosporella brunnea]|uniref:Uncharacterized protein n=1 Tax=Sphaerosporella brunnea TaxID=1250544 RepID=A0A5J5EQE4_9PEZI|nr:hypothetical protein FN846DRAFT_209003 [Sphaerosporella brunnea]
MELSLRFDVVAGCAAALAPGVFVSCAPAAQARHMLNVRAELNLLPGLAAALGGLRLCNLSTSFDTAEGTGNTPMVQRLNQEGFWLSRDIAPWTQGRDSFVHDICWYALCSADRRLNARPPASCSMDMPSLKRRSQAQRQRTRAKRPCPSMPRGLLPPGNQ